MSDPVDQQPWRNVPLEQVRRRINDLLYSERLMARSMNDEVAMDMARKLAFGLDISVKDPTAQIAMLRALEAKMAAEQGTA